MDYDSLLNRAREQIPEDISHGGERFQLPDLEVQREGKTTIVRNFKDILETMNRDEEEVVPRLLRELGAAGKYEEGRLTLQGEHPGKSIQERLDKYLEVYVFCAECSSPDTHLDKQGRTLVLQCDACGAHRPVRVRKQAKKSEESEEAIEEGKIYEMKIEDTGRQGDGVAHLDKYTIFVTGARKGMIVKALINNISGTLAFAEMTEVVDQE